MPILDEESSRIGIVHLKPHQFLAELYVRASVVNDNQYFSDMILLLFDIAAQVNNVKFEEDEIAGEVKELETNSEHDMIAIGSYIGECVAFDRS